MIYKMAEYYLEAMREHCGGYVNCGIIPYSTIIGILMAIATRYHELGLELIAM